MSSNLDRLQAAGIATQTPLPEPHRSIVDELSSEEVDALISVKRRFDGRTQVQAHQRGSEPAADEFFAVI